MAGLPGVRPPLRRAVLGGILARLLAEAVLVAVWFASAGESLAVQFNHTLPGMRIAPSDDRPPLTVGVPPALRGERPAAFVWPWLESPGPSSIPRLDGDELPLSAQRQDRRHVNCGDEYDASPETRLEMKRCRTTIIEMSGGYILLVRTPGGGEGEDMREVWFAHIKDIDRAVLAVEASTGGAQNRKIISSARSDTPSWSTS